ncbi:hypothetical protein GN956_G23278 [Arapaima gigas]
MCCRAVSMLEPRPKEPSPALRQRTVISLQVDDHHQASGKEPIPSLRWMTITNPQVDHHHQPSGDDRRTNMKGAAQ